MNITPDEVMVFCMARRVHDGEIVAQGLATPMVAAAYLLARRLHAPNLYFSSAIGQGVCRKPAPLALTRVESLWLGQSMNNVGFVRAAADILPRLRPKEFFRPAQVDAAGNFNNIAFGKNHQKPRLRLPGSGGIPDVTTVNEDIHLYVPRHSRMTFVSQLDFISGLGHHPARTQGAGARYLVSELGEFDFEGGVPGRRCMRLIHFHPGVTPAKIQAHTGFELEIAPQVCETPLPDEADLRLLRQEIDPLGIRRLESLSGAERRELMHTIIRMEKEALFTSETPGTHS